MKVTEQPLPVVFDLREREPPEELGVRRQDAIEGCLEPRPPLGGALLFEGVARQLFGGLGDGRAVRAQCTRPPLFDDPEEPAPEQFRPELVKMLEHRGGVQRRIVR